MNQDNPAKAKRTATSLFDRPLPPGYRDELRTALAERPLEQKTQAGSVLLMMLGGVGFALPTRVAAAIAPTLHIARIPHRSGTVLLGLAAFRGDLLPCASLARLLGLEARPGGTARTLILEESPSRRWATPIDAVIGFRVVGVETIARPLPLDAPLDPQWITDSFSDNGMVYYRLDHYTLFRQLNLATA
jgi:chemotaxis signal transduction protein